MTVPLGVFHLISEDESPTTNFPDIPGYLVCCTTKADIYLLFGSPHSIWHFTCLFRLHLV